MTRDSAALLAWARRQRRRERRGRFALALREGVFSSRRPASSRRGKPASARKSRTPHDASYRAFFSNPEMVESLLRDFGPPEIVQEMDFGTLERVPGDFVVPRRLRRMQSDCLWRVRLKPQEGEDSGSWCYVLLILEFQSTPDDKMPLRLLAYTALALLDSCKTLKPGDPVPLPLAFVVFNGKEEWPALTEVADVFRYAPKFFHAYLPRQRSCFLDMRRAPLENRHGYTAQLARMERSQSPKEVVDVLDELEQHLVEGSPLDESFAAWAGILLRLMDPSIPPAVIGKKLTVRQVNSMMTDVYENWLMNAQRKGIQIGLSRGEVQGIQIGKAEGIQIGEARGEARGRMNMLFSLVGDGSLSIAAAAKKANMSEDEFKAKMLDQEASQES